MPPQPLDAFDHSPTFATRTLPAWLPTHCDLSCVPRKNNSFSRVAFQRRIPERAE
jgi:hypothetical protein